MKGYCDNCETEVAVKVAVEPIERSKILDLIEETAELSTEKAAYLWSGIRDILGIDFS